MDRHHGPPPTRFDHGTHPDADLPSRSGESLFSMMGDVVIPIVIAAVPIGAFRLIGLFTRGLDTPEVTVSPSAIAAIIVLQTVGIVSMAFWILCRFEHDSIHLHARTDRHPPAWRRLALMLSIACLLLTAVLTNLGAAFAGAGLLVIAAVPTLLASLACKGIAFAGLSPGRYESGRSWPPDPRRSR